MEFDRTLLLGWLQRPGRFHHYVSLRYISFRMTLLLGFLLLCYHLVVAVHFKDGIGVFREGGVDGITFFSFLPAYFGGGLHIGGDELQEFYVAGGAEDEGLPQFLLQ